MMACESRLLAVRFVCFFCNCLFLLHFQTRQHTITYVCGVCVCVCVIIYARADMCFRLLTKSSFRNKLACVYVFVCFFVFLCCTFLINGLLIECQHRLLLCICVCARARPWMCKIPRFTNSDDQQENHKFESVVFSLKRFIHLTGMFADGIGVVRKHTYRNSTNSEL